jgi:hypothetical protein
MHPDDGEELHARATVPRRRRRVKVPTQGQGAGRRLAPSTASANLGTAMQSSALRALLVLLMLSATACRENKATPVDQPLPAPPPAVPQLVASTAPVASAPPAAPRPASSIDVGDPAVAGQLGEGFYAIETGWRWTAQKFSLTLGVPPGANEKGAAVRLKFSLPKSLLAKQKTVKLTGKVGDLTVSKAFSEPDAHVLELDLPPSALTSDSIVAEFTTDKAFSPGGQDVRVLGVLALSAELVSK